jgi:pimeloyl-ACP methyl ester carboxylesterase
MRPLEIAILLANLITAVFIGIYPGGDDVWVRVVVLVSPLFILGHVIVEKPRWQMTTAYLPAFMVLVLSWLGMATAAFHNGWFLFFWTILFVSALFLTYVMAVPRLPKPKGPYAVGTRTYHLVDCARTEQFSKDKSELRELMVQVWYPAEKPDKGHFAPFVADFDIGGPAISRRFNFPPFTMRHIDLVRTHSYQDAPLLEAVEALPVLTFSHGYLGLQSQNTWQMEELASQGYVVVAPNHTYGAVITVFPDKRVIFGLTEPPDDMPVQTAGRIAMHQWAEDTQFMLDQLSAWNEDPSHFLNGRLDLERLGFFGHSMGAGTALQTVFNKAPCRALLLLDPWLKPFEVEELDAPLSLPLLAMMSGGDFGQENGELAERLAVGNEHAATVFTIAGSGHYDYSDLPLLSPLIRLVGAKGPINGRLVARIINDYTLAFFDAHLRERPSALLNGASPYKEVQLTLKEVSSSHQSQL